MLFNDAWSQKGHLASDTAVILASGYLSRLLLLHIIITFTITFLHLFLLLIFILITMQHTRIQGDIISSLIKSKKVSSN